MPTNTEIAERAAREVVEKISQALIELGYSEKDVRGPEWQSAHEDFQPIILRAIEESQQVSENRTLDSDQDLLNAAKAKCASVTEDSRDSIEESQVQQEPSNRASKPVGGDHTRELREALKRIRDKNPDDPDVESWKWLARWQKSEAERVLAQGEPQ